MIYFRDIKTGEVFDVIDQNAELFQDDYENPADLICVNCWYCDGSGFNGRKSGFAYGTCEKDMKFIFVEEEKSNNEMEYAAVVLAATYAEPYDLLKTDSQLVVNQVTGKWRNNYAHLREPCKILAMLMKEKNLKIQWIPREENLAGKMIEVRA